MNKDPHYTLKLVLVGLLLIVTAMALYCSVIYRYAHRDIVVPRNDELAEQMRQRQAQRVILQSTVAPSPSGLTPAQIRAKQALIQATR